MRFDMSYGNFNFRWVFYCYASFIVFRIIFELAGFEQPEVLAALAVLIMLALLLSRFVYRHLSHNRWTYRLLRAHGRVIDKLVRPFGKPSLLEKWYLHIRAPKWCRASKDDLLLIYRDQNKLLFEGHIVLGMLVQAHGGLFKKGFADAPANVIYTTETGLDNPLGRLWEIAQKLFSLKGTKPEDDDERKFAGMVSYEYARDFRVTVPESLAHGLDVTYTTIMVHRKHLPEGYLSNVFFPLLVHQESRAAMILPARYWSEQMLSAWTNREKQAEETNAG